MKTWSKNTSPPEFEPILKISEDQISNETVYWSTTQKLDKSSMTALSVHRVATISNGTTTQINSPFSIGTVLAICQWWSSTSTGTGSTNSQACHYVLHQAPPASDNVWVDTAKLINIWVWTVSSIINARSVSITNNSGTAITVILTIFA